MKVLDLDGLKHLLGKFHERITTNFAAKEHTHPYAGAYHNVPGGAAYSTLRLKSDQDDSYALFCKGENTLYMHFDAKDETAELQKANIGVNHEGRAYVAANGTGITNTETHLIYDTAHRPTYTDVGAAAADHTHEAADITDLGDTLSAVQEAATQAQSDAQEALETANSAANKTIPYGDDAAQDLGAEASAGESTDVSRADHVHKLPTAAEIGAAAADHDHDDQYAAIDHTHTATSLHASATATSVAASAEPSVTLSDVDGGIQFAFKIPKGQDGTKGADGVSAGIGDADATVAQDGEPGCTVTTDGPASATNFHFAFTGLRGEKGESGDNGQPGTAGDNGKDGVGIGDITVTVDNKSSDSPTCTVTPGAEAEGKQPYTLAFSGLKGKDGAAGSAGADGKGVGTITVTSDNTTSSTPTCTVTPSDSGNVRNYTLAFKGLKGAQGVKGDNGTNGTGIGTITVTVDNTSSTSPTCTVTSSASGTNKNFTLAFKGLKGKDGTSASSSKLDAWPVGSIYLSQKSTSPASLFGGSWVQVQNGRFLKAGTTQGSPFKTGGINSIKLTSSHIPSHAHNMYLYDEAGSQKATVVQGFASGNTKGSTIQTFPYGLSSDSQLALDNKPEYIEVFVWYRTA